MAKQVAGKQGRRNRETERKGVRAAQAVFEDADYLFQLVDLANDIGKEAYVDLAESDRFAGQMIAVQVKAGEKYRSGQEYKIPCNADDVAVWRGSLVPIVGLSTTSSRRRSIGLTSVTGRKSSRRRPR